MQILSRSIVTIIRRKRTELGNALTTLREKPDARVQITEPDGDKQLIIKPVKPA